VRVSSSALPSMAPASRSRTHASVTKQVQFGSSAWKVDDAVASKAFLISNG